MQKFSGEGTPPPRPHPLGAYGASIIAPTAALKLNVTPPPKKILVTALAMKQQ